MHPCISFYLHLLVQYGDDYIKEVEGLWSALCLWPQNIRVTLNYLGRLTCVSGNLSLMLIQAKRIMMYLCRYQARPIVTELIKDLQVRLLSHVIYCKVCGRLHVLGQCFFRACCVN